MDELILRILDKGVRAPSSHNSQPWRFVIEEHTIYVYADHARQLVVSDPLARELYASVGCALENMRVAAAYEGFRADIKFVPADGTGAAAKVTFQRAERVDTDAYHAIDNRHTNRKPFIGQLSEADCRYLERVPVERGVEIAWLTGPSAKRRLLMLSEQANEIQLEDPKYRAELEGWLRYNAGEENKYHDGITHEAMGYPPAPHWLGRLLAGATLKPSVVNELDEQRISSSNTFAVLAVTEDNPTSWMKLGMMTERYALEATGRKLAYGFLNSICQVPEIADAARMHFRLGTATPVVILRFGIGKPCAVTPRRPLREVAVTETRRPATVTP